jgi:hypothetical protein
VKLSLNTFTLCRICPLCHRVRISRSKHQMLQHALAHGAGPQWVSAAYALSGNCRGASAVAQKDAMSRDEGLP